MIDDGLNPVNRLKFVVLIAIALGATVILAVLITTLGDL